MAVPPRPASASPTFALAGVPTPRLAPSEHGAPDVDDLAGIAWIVREVTHVPGVLRLRHRRLSFESTRGVLFDGTPDELELEVGRSSRAGLRVTVGAERLCVRVVRPAGGVPPCAELVARAVDGSPSTGGEADAWTVWRHRLSRDPIPVARSRTRVRRVFGGAYAPS